MREWATEHQFDLLVVALLTAGVMWTAFFWAIVRWLDRRETPLQP